MILLLSEPVDLHAKVVAGKLERRGADFFWFDHAQFPAQAQISLAYSATGRMRQALHLGGDAFDLRHITAAWDRRPSPPVPSVQIQDSITRDHVEREAAEFLSDLCHTLDCLWVPAASSTVQRARYKASQLKLAAALGFELPPTLITNSPKEFLEFYRQHNGNIVSKAFYHSIVRLGQRSERRSYGILAEPVSNRDVGYADAVRYCPTIFQAYVPKRIELRITVVGEQVFAAEIHSQQTHRTRHDWRRYDLSHTPHRPHELPEDVRRLCLQLVERFGLCYGAIDMVLTPDGRYVFLEINPNGQYLWIEELTGLPISDAICDLLMSREGAPPSGPGSFTMAPT
jgi:glutathione synthase/RimK-type ligase-like ATP-grasp enzyme